MTDWQKTRFGDDEATRAALAYFRKYGWDVDNIGMNSTLESRIYAFRAGYKEGLEKKNDK